MSNILTDDSYYIQKLHDMCQIELFSDLKDILELVIKELYYSNKRSQLLKLRLNHIDRAIFKYKQAQELTLIRNTKQYFKACLLSAISEAGLDEFA